jgi:hypothetical protein
METKNTLYSSALKGALILAVISIVYFLIMYVGNIKPVGIMMPILTGLISIAITVIFLVVSLKKYRTQTGGFISFGNAFLYCFIISAVSALIYIVFSNLFIYFIEPDYYKNIMEAQKAWMENYLAGKMPEENIAAELDKLDAQAVNMNSFGYILKTAGFTVLFGSIISLIIAAIMKKKPDVFENASGGVI